MIKVDIYTRWSRALDHSDGIVIVASAYESSVPSVTLAEVVSGEIRYNEGFRNYSYDFQGYSEPEIEILKQQLKLKLTTEAAKQAAEKLELLKKA